MASTSHNSKTSPPGTSVDCSIGHAPNKDAAAYATTDEPLSNDYIKSLPSLADTHPFRHRYHKWRVRANSDF